jgi:hypothetical protein
VEARDNAVQFDISKLTVAEIRQLDNPVLREVLLKVKERVEAEPSRHPDVMQYNSFSNFNSSVT